MTRDIPTDGLGFYCTIGGCDTWWAVSHVGMLSDGLAERVLLEVNYHLFAKHSPRRSGNEVLKFQENLGPPS